ncbi:MAG: polysaccharide deacetylase family protein, partial [Clostridiales bacterium]|nr:polysaccharide deacetylase family protein [Candidatus Apopatousia equi]
YKGEPFMHIYCVKFKTLRTIFLMILVVVLLAINIDGNTYASVYFNSSMRKVPVYYVNTDEKKVAISFDAAWGADKTEKIMEICSEYNVKATFFLTGIWVEKYPELVKKIYDNGFEIGTHSNTHPDMTKLSQSQMKLELETCCNMITEITGQKISIFRPPYGAYNDTLIETAKELDLTTIQWDVDSLDWKGISAMEITNRILNGVRCGSIILCHNNSDHILEALPIVLDRLQKKGYTITNVGDILIKGEYFIDNNGMQSAQM